MPLKCFGPNGEGRIQCGGVKIELPLQILDRSMSSYANYYVTGSTLGGGQN